MMLLWLWPWKGFYIKHPRHKAAQAKASHINQRREIVWDLENNVPCLAKLNNHLVPLWAIIIKGHCAGQLTEIHFNKPASLPRTKRKQHPEAHPGLPWQPQGTTGEFRCPLVLWKGAEKIDRINSIVFYPDQGSGPAVLWFLASRESIFKKQGPLMCVCVCFNHTTAGRPWWYIYICTLSGWIFIKNKK